jgi:hypothetical protein
MVGRARLVIAVLIASAGVPGVAFGADIPAGSLKAGPVLAGQRVIWAQDAPGKVLAVRSAPVGGGSATTVGTFTAGGRGQYARLVASDSTLAAETFSAPNSYSVDVNVFAGPASGPLDHLERDCPGSVRYPRSIDVSGTRVFFVSCDGRSGIVRDLATGAEQQVPAAPQGLRLAGHFAAWVETNPSYRIVVYDLDADATSFTITLAALHGERPDDLDLQEDGKLALAYRVIDLARETGFERVAWASPAEPRLHVVPVSGVGAYRLRITGDRIGFDRIPRGSGPFVRSEVGVSDLSGHTRLIGTGGGDDDSEGDHFDFDGRRVAWFSYGCRQAIVHVRPADATSTIRSSRHCALRFTRQPRVRHRSVRLFVDCFGFAYGACDADKVTLRDDRGRIVGSAKTFDKIRLNGLGRRLLASKHGSLKVRVAATVSDIDGRTEHRRGRAVLRSG